MAKVVLSTALSGRLSSEAPLVVPGSIVSDVLREVGRIEPGLRGWLTRDDGRIREHVNVFVNGKRAGLSDPVEEHAEVYVMQAISGGSDDRSKLLVGTKKGLFVLDKVRGQEPRVRKRHFAGQVVEYAVQDPRTGRYFAAVTHGHFGPHLFYTDHLDAEWQQAQGPAFDEDHGATVERIWIVEPGGQDGVLWTGIAPAALFRSEDNGESWQLVESLWNDPSRASWEGGLGGLTLHTICCWPGNPQRLTVAMSAVGVWISEDGGASWSRHAEGLVPRYLPEEARTDSIMHCVHKIQQAPKQPDTFYMQFHGGVYRSDDGGRAWTDIGDAGSENGLPADFGFPLVADPRDPDRALVIPLVSDVDRVPPDGNLRVYETRDRGNSWQPLGTGLPSHDAYVNVLRQAFCHDGLDPLGLYFGTGSGTVYGSHDDGAHWRLLAGNLPPVTSVRAAR